MFAALKPLFRRKPVEVEPIPEKTETVGLDELPDTESVGAVFPTIAHMAVNLSIRAAHNEIEPSLRNRSFGPQSRAFFTFRCKNTECVGGGFDLHGEIETAVAERRNSLSGRRLCQGWRSREHVNGQRCYYELNYKAHIGYKADA